MNVYKELRKKKGLTQVELSNILHVAQTTISKWEKGKTIPDLPTLVQLSKFFNVPVDTLLKNTDSISYFPTPTVGTILSEDKNQLIETIKNLSDENCRRVQAFITGITIAEEEKQALIQKFTKDK